MHKKIFSSLFIKSLIPYLIGLVILATILFPFFSTAFIVKYDYMTQHIPFYQEFYRLIEEGMPFWSWNGFLGLNFYASKTYYLIGDIYAWISVLIYNFNSDIPKTFSILLLLKFVVSYSTFYVLTKQWKLRSVFSILLSLLYALSGWNLMFLEQPMFTSFYSLIPLLFIGLEIYFEKHSLTIITLSVSLLVATNFYLFWMISLLFLLYFIFRFIQLSKFKLSEFIKTSFILMLSFVIGVGLVSFIWLPGVLHLMQSGRAGTFLDTFNSWSQLQINSFIAFTFIPNLRYEDGIFKDFYYYFNQVSFYVNILLILIIPQLGSKGIDKKLKITSTVYILLLFLLLISPKIGIFFNFSYSLRYTYIHTFMMLFLGAYSLKNIHHWSISITLMTQSVISIVFAYLLFYAIPISYPTLPSETIEITLLKYAFIFSLIYSSIIIGMILNRDKKYQSVFIYLLIILSIFEISYFSTQNFKSIEGEGIVYSDNQDFKDALNYIHELDSSFYRIYTNYLPEYENLSYSYDFNSIKTHDTMYQYTLQDFLQISRQYPYIHWGFDLHDFSILQLVDVKYEIVMNDKQIYPNGLYMASKLPLEFGPFSIYQYNYEIGFAKTYTSYKDINTLLGLDIESKDYYVSDIMDALSQDVYLDPNKVDLSLINNSQSESQYFQATLINNNYIELDIDITNPSIIVLNMPYDKGWSVKNGDTKISTYTVQGGFMGMILDSGNYHLNLKFIPSGFIVGSIISFINFILLMGYHFRDILLRRIIKH